MELGGFQRHDFLYKVVILGDAKVGKTCIAKRFTEDVFSEDYLPTMVVDFKTKIVNHNGKAIKLQIW